MLSAAVSCHATWYNDIYNTLAAPIPSISSGAAAAGALGVCSFSYLVGKCNGQDDTINYQNELTQMTKERDKEKAKADKLDTEVNFLKSRQTLIDFTQSDTDPHLKKVTTAIAVAEKSLEDTASKFESLRNNFLKYSNDVYASVRSMDQHLNSHYHKLQWDIENNTNVITSLVQGVLLTDILSALKKTTAATLRQAQANNAQLARYQKALNTQSQAFETALKKNQDQTVSRLKNLLLTPPTRQRYQDTPPPYSAI